VLTYLPALDTLDDVTSGIKVDILKAEKMPIS